MVAVKRHRPRSQLPADRLACRERSLFRRLRPYMLPMMVGLLFLYGALHSPLRSIIARSLGLQAQSCYFVCRSSLTVSRIADSWSSLAAILVAGLAAWLVADWYDGTRYERPLAFGLSMLAFIVMPAATVGGVGAWAHLPLLRPPAGPLLVGLPAALVVGFGLYRGWRPHGPNLHAGQLTPLVLLIGALGAGLLLASVAVSLMHPPAGGDAVSYHAPLAVFLWHDGNLGAFLARAPDTWALAWPGTAELWFGLLLVGAGERIADLGQLPFALLGSASIYAFTRRVGLRHGAALLAGCGFLLVPMVVMQSGMQVNDVVGAALVMASIALASAPAESWTSQRLVLLGVGLGLTVTTKLALLPAVVAVGLFVVGGRVWDGRRRYADVVGALVLLGLPFSVVVAPWWIRNVLRYGNPLYPQALPFLGHGLNINGFGAIDSQFVPSPLAWPLYPLFEAQDDRSGFGALCIVGLLPGLIFVARRGRRRPFVLYGLVTLLTLPAWWKYSLHEPRFLLVIVGLGLAFLPGSLLALSKDHRKMGAIVIGTAAIFSALVTIDQGVIPFAVQPNVRSEFYDHVWAVDPAAVSLPDSQGILWNTGYAPTLQEYAAYYPLLGRSLHRVVIPVEGDDSTESIVAKMRRAHVQYAYVAASPSFQRAVEAKYDGRYFELVHMSVVLPGERSGARRFLYREVSVRNVSGTRRYLYRLKQGPHD
jgi:hypothetical protein